MTDPSNPPERQRMALGFFPAMSADNVARGAVSMADPQGVVAPLKTPEQQHTGGTHVG